MAEKEYLDRETVIKKLNQIGGCDASDDWEKGFDKAIEVAIKVAENLPAADIAPVRHVTNRAKYFGETLCPNCGIHLDETTIISKDENEDGDIIHYEFQPNFCANCGARMDGDPDD